MNALNDADQTPLDLQANRIIYDLLVAAGGTSVTGELPPRPAEGPHPLIVAVARDEAAVVRALIDGGADVNLVLNQGETLLFLAAALDRQDLVRLLLELGAEVNVVSENGQTALDLAPNEGMREILTAAGGRPGGGGGVDRQ